MFLLRRAPRERLLASILTIALASMFCAPATTLGETTETTETASMATTPSVEATVVVPAEEPVRPGAPIALDVETSAVIEAAVTALGSILSNTFGDAYEVDNVPAAATVIVPGASAQYHTLHVIGDVDWVMFEASADAVYAIQTMPGAASLDTEIRVFDSELVEVGYNDDASRDGYSALEFAPDASGTYYVAVRASADAEMGEETGAYRLVIGCTTGDEFEVDDTLAEANAITVDGAVQAHTLWPESDVDWIKFDAVQDVTYVMQTFEGDSGLDTVITVYDADGLELDEDDDGGDGLFSRLEFTPDADGVYYVAVRGYSAGEVGAYRVSVVTASLSADAYEVDNTLENAVDIVVGASAQTHSIHEVSDEDWMVFEATAGETYVIETHAGSLYFDTELALYDADGNELAYDDDGGLGLFSRISYTPAVSGDVYVLVHGYRYAETGVYKIDVVHNVWTVAPDAYEYDDELIDANPIAVDGAPQAHTLHSIDDNDYVTFDVVAGVTYTIYTVPGTDDLDPALILFHEDGNSFVVDDDSGVDEYAAIEYTATTTESLYALVANDSSAVGEYTLIVAGDAPDSYESDDIQSDANLISVDGAPQLHTLHVAGDKDWVKFPVAQGVTYVVDTTGYTQSSPDTMLSLYTADGTELDFDDDNGACTYSHLEFTADETCMLWLEVSEYWDYVGAYQLSVDCDDVTAPVTTSDAVAAYTDSATITLSATDVGGVGVAATYYGLDGGAKQVYADPIAVTAVGEHTLEFWSVDNVTNDEAVQTVSFTIVSAPSEPADPSDPADGEPTDPSPFNPSGSSSDDDGSDEFAGGDEPTGSVEPTASTEATQAVPASGETVGASQGSSTTSSTADDTNGEQKTGGSPIWWIAGLVLVVVAGGAFFGLRGRGSSK